MDSRKRTFLVAGIVVIAIGLWVLLTVGEETDRDEMYYTVHTLRPLVIFALGMGIILFPFLRRR